MKRRFWAGLLSFVMLWSLLPASALAANEEAELETEVSTSENSPVQVKKTINGDGTKLTLEAYVTNEVTQTSSTKPLDIVLVLDVSGSMAYNFDGNDKGSTSERCQYAMKQAVSNFIDKVNAQDSQEGNHRMAIVTFGSNASTLQNWTYVDANGLQELKTQVKKLPSSPSSATNVGAGMKKALELISAKSDTNPQKVVIVFTDGVPTTRSDFDTDVANRAITAANSMKNTGVTVYTVGIFNGANPAQLHGDEWNYTANPDVPCSGEVGSCWGGSWLSDLFGNNDFDAVDVPAGNRFLNYLSSNFGSADKIGIKKGSYHPGHTIVAAGTGWKIEQNFKRTASDYYLTAQDSASLNNMFQQIIQEISKLEIKADANAILSDTLSEYFTFDGVTAKDTSEITVKTAEVDDVNDVNDVNATTGAYKWKEAKPFQAKVKVDGRKLEVTGFDYTANAVTKTTQGDKVVSYSGSKLIVTIPIKPDTNCKTWRAGKNAYVTNDTVTNKAGLSGYTDKEGTPLETVLSDSPEAMVTAYTVTYKVTGEAPQAKDYEDSRAYITGQSASVLAAPESPVEKDGFKYTFDGWMNGTEKAGKTIDIVDHDVTLTGAWSKEAIKPTEYKLKYEWNGGAATANAVYTADGQYAADAGIDVPAEDEAVYKDHTFAGWYTDKELTQPWTGTTMPAHDLTLYAKWEENTPDPTTGSVVITKMVEGVDEKDIASVKGFDFNVEDLGAKEVTIAGTGSVGYDADTGRLTNTEIDHLEAGSYVLSEDLDKAMSAIPGYELVGVRFVEIGKESESAVQTDTDDGYGDYNLTITADDIAFVTCINTYKKTETAPTTGSVVITKQVEGVDDADIAQIKELTFNVKKGDEIVKNGNLHYDGTKLTTAAIDLEAGSYVLSEDQNTAMSAIPGYELVGVRFAETGKESEPDTQAATDDTATTAFGDYRFEIKTSDSAIFVTCINTYEKKEVEPDTYTVTYTDGANGTAFANQVYTVHAGDKTPAFNGTPTRSGYTFTGWTPAVAETVTGNAIYTATWTKNSSGRDDDSDTYYLAIKKIDAQDGHVLKDAKFGLYADDEQIAAATSGSKGYARFSLDERVYNKLNKNDDLYVMELTAPDGYVKSSRKYDVSVNDFVKNNVIGAQKQAITVTNSRSSTPDRLNDEEHFAYVIGYKDGNVRPYGLISRAETTTIFFRLLKDSVRDGNLLTSNTYTDVADNYWANTAISTMTGLGIVQGRTATTFDPYAPITRAQFAAICARFDDGKTQGDQTFTDIQGHWAQAYIERAAELGWIKGFEDGTFRPDTYITRAQAMTMINRVLNRIPEDADDLLSNMNVWPDCNPGDWFYLAVQEATNSHDYKHKAGNYETWSSMNKDPDWTRYEN